MIVAAKIGGELVARAGQPPVLGELLMGIVLGNLGLFGFTALEPLRSNEFLNVAAEIGAVLLLFETGIESELAELLSVGWSALLAAILGSVTPLVMGYYVSELLIPDDGWIRRLVVGGTLTATSVGITARVLKDLHKTDTKEARIIFGAAVADDVIGLVVLGVITGIITAGGGQSGITWTRTLWIIAKAVLFLAGAIAVARAGVPRVLRYASRLRVPGVLVGLCIAFCFVLSALADGAGLAPILGAFAAGVVLEEAHYQPFLERGERTIREQLFPINTLLVPVFFVVMGMRMDLTAFASWSVAAFAALITVTAILGKAVCGLGALERGVDRLVIGLGMIPRGEVGLIFAGLGATLLFDGQPVLDRSTYSAMVLMVLLTTVLTPPLLKAAFARNRKPGLRKEPAR